ncbi:MAG: hypothetical protein WBC91_17770 [Phototrophicaceae bacterium]
MSKAKFIAAKELMKEGYYDEARGILNTIDHPTAVMWLRRIDKLQQQLPYRGHPVRTVPKTVMPPSMPPMNSYAQSASQGNSEQDRYYRRENRRSRFRDIGNGLYIIILGIMCFAGWAFFSGFLFGINTGMRPFEGGNLAMFGMGVIALFLGFIRIIK